MINYNRETHLACLSVTVLLTYITRNSIQAGFACRQTFRSSNVIFLFVFVCVSVFMNYKVSGVGIFIDWDFITFFVCILHKFSYSQTINDCHTSGRFDPPFSWEMPVPSREYDSCFLVSHLVMS